MAKKWGKADFEQLKAFQDRLSALDETNLQKFCKAASKELAARLLALVIPRTPVGEYGENIDKNGGTLRRGWTGGVEQDPVLFAQSLPITKSGDSYTITVENAVFYASYVEFGHRQTPGRFVPVIGKRLKRPVVEGQYMLTNSITDLEQIAPSVLQKKLERFLKEVLGGNG